MWEFESQMESTRILYFVTKILSLCSVAFLAIACIFHQMVGNKSREHKLISYCILKRNQTKLNKLLSWNIFHTQLSYSWVDVENNIRTDLSCVSMYSINSIDETLYRHAVHMLLCIEKVPLSLLCCCTVAINKANYYQICIFCQFL